MTGLLVDSDVLIEVARGRDGLLLGRWTELANSEALILYSPVSAAELWHGARPLEEPALAALFGDLTCLPLDAATGRRAGELLRRLGKGHGLQLADALIAAAALEHAVALWTRNRKHYDPTGVEFLD